MIESLYLNRLDYPNVFINFFNRNYLQDSSFYIAKELLLLLVLLFLLRLLLDVTSILLARFDGVTKIVLFRIEALFRLY